MRHFAFILAFVGLSTAQAVGDYLPECAIPCFAEAISSSTTCQLDNPQCQCQRENILAISAASSTCLVGACGQDVLNSKVGPGAREYCDVANSALNVTTTTIAATASSSSMAGVSTESSTTSILSITASSSKFAIATSSMTTQASSTFHSTQTSTVSSGATATPTVLETSVAAASSRVGPLCVLVVAAFGVFAIL